MDFTLKTYSELLGKLLKENYFFQTYEEFLQKPLSKVVVLRQDVDKAPDNSLTFGRLQHSLGIKSSFYFRVNNKKFADDIIGKLHDLGHEIGYHYEDIAVAAKLYPKIVNESDLSKCAIKTFEENLGGLREIAPVKTICMHGSPFSKWDNRILWKYFDYRNYGIIGEPYFDTDFNEVQYFSDTGRRWNGQNFSVRDKVSGHQLYNDRLKSTSDIILALDNHSLCSQIMMTFHPQRWTDNKILWSKEYIIQNLKNHVKRVYAKKVSVSPALHSFISL